MGADAAGGVRGRFRPGGGLEDAGSSGTSISALRVSRGSRGLMSSSGIETMEPSARGMAAHLGCRLSSATRRTSIRQGRGRAWARARASARSAQSSMRRKGRP
jgi:hypothetical protein